MTGEAGPSDYAAERHSMVENQLRKRGIRDERVLQAMARVPRHEFVAGSYRPQAYEDHPISIAEGQTISQPFIVAVMLAVLALQPGDTVLEVGTGSGYQTALLAELTHQVYSVERHAALAQGAKAILSRLGYDNVSVITGDGSLGLPSHSPFHAIIVAAAAPQLPPSLVGQLCLAGRMVIPVGPPDAQELQLVRKNADQLAITRLEACRFVPLVGSEGYRIAW